MAVDGVRTFNGVDFRLFALSPARRLARLAHLRAPTESMGVFLLVFFTWLTLLVLAAVDGRLHDGPWPLVRDIAAHTRLLVELPALMLGKRISDVLFGRAIQYLVSTRVVGPEQREALTSHLRTFAGLRDSALAAIGICAGAYLLSWLEFRVGFGKVDWWKTTGNGDVSLAGYWYYLVARPLVLAQLLWWLWALVRWSWLLVSLVRLPMHVLAFHPDGVGGLNPVLVAHRAFACLGFALGTDIAGALANRMLNTTQPLAMYQTTLVAFVVVVSCVLVSPLVVVVRILLPARIQAMQEYDSMACELARVMRQKSLEAETSLNSVDTYSLISAHTDSRQGLESVGHTKPFMLTRNYVLWFVLATGIPIAVAALTRLPIEQIVRQLLKLATT